MKILIADDEELIRFTLRDMIEKSPLEAEILEASGGRQLIRRFRREKPDLVLADIRMPGCSGLEAMEELRDEEGHWIILTGHADFEYARSALKLGALDYLLKPPSSEELLAALERAEKLLPENKRFPQTDMPGEGGESGESSGSALVDRAVRIIGKRYKEELGIAQVAYDLNVTPNYLSSQFRRHTGKAFTRYITDKRIAAARDLMENSNLNIKEISSGLGYRSSRHFAALFRKETGTSPSDYIRLHRK